jgi:hypothetical protein
MGRLHRLQRVLDEAGLEAYTVVAKPGLGGDVSCTFGPHKHG